MAVNDTLLLLFSSDMKYAEFCLRSARFIAGKVMLPVTGVLWKQLWKYVGLFFICVIL